MTHGEQVQLLKRSVPEWNQWRKENPEIVPDLQRTDLYGAYLHGADLHGAYLHGANLYRADLQRTDLEGANLEGANLDPKAPANAQVDDFQKANQHSVIGYRTKVSAHIPTMQESGSFEKQVYEPGQVYQAPVFSVCSNSCHPGLYLAPSIEWLQEHGYRSHGPYVKVRANIQDVHQAGDKWRCRSFTVIIDAKNYE